MNGSILFRLAFCLVHLESATPYADKPQNKAKPLNGYKPALSVFGRVAFDQPCSFDCVTVYFSLIRSLSRELLEADISALVDRWSSVTRDLRTRLDARPSPLECCAVQNSAPAQFRPVLLRHRADQVILVVSEGKTL